MLNFPDIIYDKSKLLETIENEHVKPLAFWATACYGSSILLDCIIQSGINLFLKDGSEEALGFSGIKGAIANNPKYSEEIIPLIINSGFDINYQGLGGITAISFAANRDSIACVKKIKSLGGNPDIKNASGMNSLGYIIHDNVELAKLLITSKTDFNAKGMFGKSLKAHHKSNKKIMKLICPIV